MKLCAYIFGVIAVASASEQADRGNSRCEAWGGIEGPNGLVSDTLHAHAKMLSFQPARTRSVANWSAEPGTSTTCNRISSKKKTHLTPHHTIAHHCTPRHTTSAVGLVAGIVRAAHLPVVTGKSNLLGKSVARMPHRASYRLHPLHRQTSKIRVLRRTPRTAQWSSQRASQRASRRASRRAIQRVNPLWILLCQRSSRLTSLLPPPRFNQRPCNQQATRRIVQSHVARAARLMQLRQAHTEIQTTVLSRVPQGFRVDHGVLRPC